MKSQSQESTFLLPSLVRGVQSLSLRCTWRRTFPLWVTPPSLNWSRSGRLRPNFFPPHFLCPFFTFRWCQCCTCGRL